MLEINAINFVYADDGPVVKLAVSCRLSFLDFGDWWRKGRFFGKKQSERTHEERKKPKQEKQDDKDEDDWLVKVTTRQTYNPAAHNQFRVGDSVGRIARWLLITTDTSRDGSTRSSQATGSSTLLSSEKEPEAKERDQLQSHE